MHYFFNVSGESAMDQIGVDLPTLEAAKHYALNHARELLSDYVFGNLICEQLRMIVTDGNGQSVYVLDFTASVVPYEAQAGSRLEAGHMTLNTAA